MRLLIVGFATSIHVARWISQISDQGWDIHLFPSTDLGYVHAQLDHVTVYHSIYAEKAKLSVKEKGVYLRAPIRGKRLQQYTSDIATGLRKLRMSRDPAFRSKQLARTIDEIRPDVIHSMEFQAAGYMTEHARQLCKQPFPPWIASNYGSDIYLFGRLKDHQRPIQAVLKHCDYYTCECLRDFHLAKQMGLKGDLLGVIPNGGGFDLKRFEQFRRPGPTSSRQLILIKGYQNFAGRALVALRALELCADVLQNYQIAVHLPLTEDVRIRAELASQRIGVPIELVPPTTHENILRLYGRARVHVGLSISDAASTSMLEAMALGALPIQSCTACTEEWFADGEGGLVVPPEDPDKVAIALRRALTDDALVDRAAAINYETVKERLDQKVVKEKILDAYQTVLEREYRTNS